MCGIAGLFDLRESRNIDQDLLESMTRSLVHRGPDGEGYHREPGVGFGHRRLSIIDLEGGHQPIFNEDNSVVVTYNGEIYNFQPIQEELESLGHVFRTRCDTEVIVHAWEEWGAECLHRFNGMFAFAIWDRNRKQLFIARDRIGIKPLYYGTTEDGYLAFGSELKALLIHPRLSRAIRPDAVEEYFAFGYVPDPKTILSNVWKLPPGHCMTIESGKPLPEPRQYWDIDFGVDPVPEATMLSEINERLAESVQRRMIAEVKLGAFLSGGVDSSAVVAHMAGLTDDPTITASISFGDPAYNESSFAKIVADQYKTNHFVRQVDPADYALVDQLADFYDEPFADSSALPTYRVCELAREHVTVALSGDGGDENFIGYRRYRWHAYEEKIRNLLPHGLRKPVFGTLGAIYPKMDWAPKFLRAKSTLQALGRSSMEGYLHSVGIFPDHLRKKLFSDKQKSALQGYEAIEVYRRHAERQPDLKGLPLVQYLDFKTYLPGDILTKVDRASMAHSLEVRVPILDHEYVQWVAGIPAEHKLVGREGKHCFKKALEPLLPDDILYRDKMGFGVPVSSWFRNELKDDIRRVVDSPALLDSGLFDRSVLRELVDSHQSGQSEHSAVLWALLMFNGSMKKLGLGQS
ncbi:MAG: XrtA/PEP-CTERM system amidotransferase [Pseudomonadota bacterium]